MTPFETVSSDESARRVVAMVLTWNDTELTRACLRSLRAASWSPLTVVVVDNGSRTPVLDLLSAEFPDILGLRLEENRGFVGGCNAGIARALELGAEYVFLLNNDTVVGQDAIRSIVLEMEDRPDVALASAILLDVGEPKVVQSYRGWIDRDRALITRPHEGEPLSAAHRVTIESQFVPACALMMRASALRAVGLFDERLHTNWEDYDLCLRMTDSGWKILMVGAAEVTHRRHQTTGATSPYITYYGTRNQLICLARYGAPLKIVCNLPFIARTFYWRIRDYGLLNLKGHRAFLLACFDFLAGVRGRGHAPIDTRDAGRSKPKAGAG
jgi:GT2 family glycosyltransferase